MNFYLTETLSAKTETELVAEAEVPAVETAVVAETPADAPVAESPVEAADAAAVPVVQEEPKDITVANSADEQLNAAETTAADAAAATAGFVAATYWLLMLVGRFVSSLISGKVSSRVQLGTTCFVAIILVVAAIFSTNVPASMPVFTGKTFVMAEVPLTALLLVCCGLCTSVMWGTIFNLSVEGLGKNSALASGLFMTMVVGGGVLPLIQNAVADAAGFMTSYWVIVAALVYMLWFAVLGSRVKKA